MMAVIYAGKVMTCSAILFGYYFFFLRNKKFHQYNRYYLLTCASFSFLFPLLHIPAFYHNSTSGGTFIKTLSVISSANWEEEIILIAHRNTVSSFLTFQNSILAVYITGVMICTYYIANALRYIKKLSKMYKKELLESIAVYNTCEPGTPFSFFRSLFWNQHIELASEKGQQILRHELFHIRAGHSYDIMFMRCITTLFWFNPFFYLFTKEIKAIHEFLADEHASSSVNKYDYAELLVTEAINNKTSLITHQFFHHQIKRRIAMLIQNHPSNFTYFRRIMALPLLFILFCAFAFKSSTTHAFSDYFYAGLNEPITVVIDAGHGGEDPGASGLNGMHEKDINLSIAEKIKELSKSYGINVIMTREKDERPGNASTTKQSILNRVNILQHQKADLFVSIHVGSRGTLNKAGYTNGFEIYVSDKNDQYTNSKQLGSSITEQIKKTYKIAEALKQINSVYVLSEMPVPAVLIECGYMTSQKDLDFITQKENQEKIAHDILRGIVNYQKNAAAVSHSYQEKEKAIDTIPASEFITLLQKNEVANSTIDAQSDRITATLKNGESIVTRWSEFKTLSDNHFAKHDVSTSDTAEDEASFPGGKMAWMRFLNKNFKYPMEAQKNEIQGTVIVQFMVDEKGNVGKVEVVSGPVAGGLREEAGRLIKVSGVWIPATKNGQPVASLKKQPFIFRLDRE